MRVILVLSELVKDGRPGGEKASRSASPELRSRLPSGSPGRPTRAGSVGDLLELDFVEDIFVEELVSFFMG